MSEMDWPSIHEYEDVAEQIYQVIKTDRAERAPTVADEVALQRTVETHVHLAQESPQRYGISAGVQSRLSEVSYSDQVVKATMVRASAVWPLSRLIYMVPYVEEITCFGHDRWTLLGGGGKVELTPETSPFRDDDAVVQLFRSIVSMTGITGNTRFDESHPLAECVLGPVLRLSCSMAPVVSGDYKVQGSIRLPMIGMIRTLEEYVPRVFPAAVAQVLRAFVDRRVNTLIAGGTNTGKTTLLRVMCGLIPDSELVCVIEKGAELHLESLRPVEEGDQMVMKPWVRYVMPLATIPSAIGGAEGRDLGDAVSMGDLVRASLRYTPDRVILGEARGEEAFDCLEAMNTGHDGSMMTVHADSGELALARMRQLVMHHEEVTDHELADMTVRSALEAVVHLKRDASGRRTLTEITMVNRTGAPVPIYREDDAGKLVRVMKSVEDANRLHHKLRGAFPGDTFPEV